MKSIKITLRQNTDKRFLLSLESQDTDADAFIPPIPEKMKTSLENWQLGYYEVTSNSDYQAATDALKEDFNRWVNSIALQDGNSQDNDSLPIKEQLIQIVTYLKRESDCIPILLNLKDKEAKLHHLPWQEWDLFEQCNCSVEFAVLVHGKGDKDIYPPLKHRKVKILLVVGRTEGISTKEDLEIIQDLEKKGAEVTALIQPSYKQLCDALSDRGYHIFIFTGHSGSKEDGSIGWIELNETESLKIDRFKNALKAAIEQGLQLAIFNSCDGLGLANQLAKLNLPQSIVMREPVPDEVAVEFLKHFFAEFTENKSLFASVHYARKRLEHFTIPKESDDFYPGVTWLPTLCVRQTALNQPLTWNRLMKPIINISSLLSYLPSVTLGCLVSLTGFLVFYLFNHPGSFHRQNPLAQSKPIKIDGSSTVHPISDRIATKIQAIPDNKLKINVNYSGTGGGFQKFCRGEIDINDASRKIKPEEIELCKKNGVNSIIKVLIAFDALSVVVNPKNNSVNNIHVDELKKMWKPEAEGKVIRWNQIRDNLPERDFKLFAPGSDSGTFDYFTEEIVGKQGASRRDYNNSENDEVILEGVRRNPWALGYFGYSYYANNPFQVKALAIDNGSGAVLPSIETVKDGSYPLSRPLFIYINANEAKKRPELQKFVNYYLAHAKSVAKEVKFIPLEKDRYEEIFENFKKNGCGAFEKTEGSQTTIWNFFFGKTEGSQTKIWNCLND